MIEGREVFIRNLKVKVESFLSRMRTASSRFSNVRVGNVRIWFAELDIPFEWRELGEGILLSLLSIILYLSVILTQFAFVPFMVIAVKRGWREGVFYLAGATVIFFYLMSIDFGRFPLDNGLLSFSPVHFTFEFIGNTLSFKWGKFFDFFILFGGYGTFLGYLVSRNYRLGYVVFIGLFVYAILVALLLLIAGFIGGFERFLSDYTYFVDEKIDRYVQVYLAQLDSYRSLILSKGINYSLIGKKIQVAAEIYKRTIVLGFGPKGGYLIKQIIIIFLSILFVGLYLKGKLRKAAFSFNLRNYRLDEGWVWGLIFSWFFVYVNLHLGNSLLGIISWNAALLISFLYFLKGLVIIKIGSDILNIPLFFQLAVLLFLLFYSPIFFITIVTGIGVADIWLKFHENILRIKRGRNK